MNHAAKFYKLLAVFLCYEGKEFWKSKDHTFIFYLKIISFIYSNIGTKNF